MNNDGQAVNDMEKYGKGQGFESSEEQDIAAELNTLLSNMKAGSARLLKLREDVKHQQKQMLLDNQMLLETVFLPSTSSMVAKNATWTPTIWMRRWQFMMINTRKSSRKV